MMIRLRCRTSSRICPNPAVYGCAGLCGSRAIVNNDDNYHPHLALHEALCDGHPPNAVALRYQNVASDAVHELTFGQLRHRSQRLAWGLHTLAGVQPGHVVAGMLPKGPQLMEVAVAAARLGAVYQPLFTAFQEEGIRARMDPRRVKAVVTDSNHLSKWQHVVQQQQPQQRQTVFCVTRDGSNDDIRDLPFEWHDYEQVITSAPDNHATVASPAIAIQDNAPMALLYSSGTTGPPKGILCPTRALINFQIYLLQGLGLELPTTDESQQKQQQLQRYWNIADAGWAYGLYYNVYGPLYTGITAHMLCAPFTPASTLQFLARHEITSFAAAPTVYRALRSCPDEMIDEHAAAIAAHLRTASSAGEPLSPAVSRWFQDRLGGVPILNHYGQTENGMMINQHARGQRRTTSTKDGPSSCGVPMEGFDGACLLDERGNRIDEPHVDGALCMKVDECSHFWFRGYTNRPEDSLTDQQGYYHTGDRASYRIVDNDDGSTTKCFVFSGRDDDVILTAGYRVGPAEVEGFLLQLEYVLEVAVVGVPDEVKGSVIHVYVVHKEPQQLTSDKDAAGRLALEIQQHVKQHLAKHLVPKFVTFVASLPKTDSGKIKRYLLRQGILEE